MKVPLRMNSLILHFILSTTILLNMLVWDEPPILTFRTFWKKKRKWLIKRIRNRCRIPAKQYEFSLFSEDCFASMCGWLNLGALDLLQQAAVRRLRDDRDLYVKRYAVIREMVICLSLLPDGIAAQMCAFMSLWSKTEITATAPICFHAWRLYLLTFSGIFASHIDLWLQ